MIRKVEMERFTVISARPFNEVVAAIKTSIGNPNLAEFWKSTQEAKSATQMGTAIERVLGRTGLMLFVEFDHGMIVRNAPSATCPQREDTFRRHARIRSCSAVRADKAAEFRRIALNPAPDRNVIHSDVPLRHDLLEITQAERISQITTNAQNDDVWREMSPLE
jgi:hypothetical protein